MLTVIFSWSFHGFTPFLRPNILNLFRMQKQSTNITKRKENTETISRIEEELGSRRADCNDLQWLDCLEEIQVLCSSEQHPE